MATHHTLTRHLNCFEANSVTGYLFPAKGKGDGATGEIERQLTYCSKFAGIGIVSVRQASWRVPAGASPAQVRRSGGLVVSVAWWKATTTARGDKGTRYVSPAKLLQ